MNIIWRDGTVSGIPYILLRDSCQCPQCTGHQTIVNTSVEFGLDIKVEEATVCENGRMLRCSWPDGHRSDYPSNFLFNTTMSEKRKGRKNNVDDLVKDELVLWNREMMQDKIPAYEYDAVMNDDTSLFNSLYELYRRGIILVNNAPKRAGVPLEIISRVGWVKTTNFG